MKIAIIGSGISGMGAAWLLNDIHDITVFEKNNRLGGHSNTLEVNYDGEAIPVDTGFIVYNELNYPNLTALFRHLDVSTEDSCMSFSFSMPGTKVEWSGDSLDTIFAYRQNAYSPKFLKMLANVLRFNKQAARDLEMGALQGLSLAEYLDWRGFGDAFRDYYLLPMGSAIWSTSVKDMLDYPAVTFVRFFANHKLINQSSERPQWRTVSGGSREYVKRLTSCYADRIRLNENISRVERNAAGVVIHFNGKEPEYYDRIIFACHSDEALELLSNPSGYERALLGAISYSPNKAVLHRDVSLMPSNRKTWASWNVRREKHGLTDEKPASLTYWMNRLQNIDHAKPLFVSLNPNDPIDQSKVFAEIEYDHPLYNKPALEAQEKLDILQGVQNTYFCGAYFGYGFHEDGLAAGLNVAEMLGGKRPWSADANFSPGLTYAQAAE